MTLRNRGGASRPCCSSCSLTRTATDHQPRSRELPWAREIAVDCGESLVIRTRQDLPIMGSVFRAFGAIRGPWNRCFRQDCATESKIRRAWSRRCPSLLLLLLQPDELS